MELNVAKPHYDPLKLLNEVRGLLAEHGLNPQPVEGFNRLTLASDLLRSYSIEPEVQAESVLDLDGHERYHKRMGHEN